MNWNLEKLKKIVKYFMEIKMKWWGKQNTVVNYRTKRTKQKSHIASKKKTETWDFRNKVWSSIQQSKKQIIHRSRQIGMFTQAHNLINSKLTRERFNEKKPFENVNFHRIFHIIFFLSGKRTSRIHIFYVKTFRES